MSMNIIKLMWTIGLKRRLFYAEQKMQKQLRLQNRHILKKTGETAAIDSFLQNVEVSVAAKVKDKIRKSLNLDRLFTLISILLQ